MKHQVLFFLSTFSFLSYASEHSRALADTHYGAQLFRMTRKTGRIDPIEQVRFTLQCNEIASTPMTAAEKEAGLLLIQKSMQKDGSWNDLLKWNELYNGPTKRREIR